MLGVETSCDDTAAAVVRSDGVVLGECIASQADIHEVIARRAAVCVTMVVVLCVCHRGCVPRAARRRCAASQADIREAISRCVMALSWLCHGYVMVGYVMVAYWGGAAAVRREPGRPPTSSRHHDATMRERCNNATGRQPRCGVTIRHVVRDVARGERPTQEPRPTSPSPIPLLPLSLLCRALDMDLALASARVINLASFVRALSSSVSCAPLRNGAASSPASRATRMRSA